MTINLMELKSKLMDLRIEGNKHLGINLNFARLTFIQNLCFKAKGFVLNPIVVTDSTSCLHIEFKMIECTIM